jgi:hypothetical protein
VIAALGGEGKAVHTGLLTHEAELIAKFGECIVARMRGLNVLSLSLPGLGCSLRTALAHFYGIHFAGAREIPSPSGHVDAARSCGNGHCARARSDICGWLNGCPCIELPVEQR